MARTYRAELDSVRDGVATVRTAWGEPATNAELVPDALLALASLNLTGGRGIKFTGPASLPVAFALAHAVSHIFGFVACFDPKLSKYVVAISHDPQLRPGDLID